MYQGKRIAVVVPAHNEERHIAEVLRTMPEYVDHILVVDDASADRTSAAAAEVQDPRVEVLRNTRNLGVGGSVLRGYERAIELDADIAVKMDGDGQMDPDFLSELLDPLLGGEVKYTKGNRFLAGEALQAMPTHRLWGNIGLTFFNKLASGYWNVFDPQNGYTAINVRTLTGLDRSKIHSGYFFENDMLVHLNLLHSRVIDVAIPARYGDEKSDLNPFKVGLSFPFLLLRRFFYRIYQKYVLRDFSPIALFLGLGGLLFLWGTFLGFYLWIKAIYTAVPSPTGTIMLSLLPLILGFQLLLQAIVLDIQETPGRSP
ncbi:MAG TPA: glycosyltransferase family 2 protein [bacterium]|nr:glycosyltransferase family 2 protein [bacterium]